MHIEEIGEHEGKKSLFENVLVVSKLTRSAKRPSAKDPANLVKIFKYFFHFNGEVNYMFDRGITL